MFAKEGYSNIAVAGAVSLVLLIVGLSLTGFIAVVLFVAAGLLLCFILFFFRDPDRNIPDDPNLILAPADGKIVSIKEIQEDTYIKGRAHQISIFLSVVDVHVNRLPAAGQVEYLQYHPGKYLMAWDEKASTQNERTDFGLQHESGKKIFFRQITGFLARRIVYHIKKDDEVQAGKRFGMMKFGSRMDVLIPAHINVEVQEGDKTTGGETVLARINSA